MNFRVKDYDLVFITQLWSKAELKTDTYHVNTPFLAIIGLDKSVGNR